MIFSAFPFALKMVLHNFHSKSADEFNSFELNMSNKNDSWLSSIEIQIKDFYSNLYCSLKVESQ